MSGTDVKTEERERVAWIVMEHYDAHPRSIYGTDAHGLADKILAALGSREEPVAWVSRETFEHLAKGSYRQGTAYNYCDDPAYYVPLYAHPPAPQESIRGVYVGDGLVIGTDGPVPSAVNVNGEHFVPAPGSPVDTPDSEEAQ